MDYSKEDIISLLNAKGKDILSLICSAESKRDTTKITYSKNVFLPITDICRNECGYCTFKKTPDDENARILMNKEEIFDILYKADEYKCKEALFTFGERPEETEEVKIALEELGYQNMIEYLYFICDETLKKTGLLPHSNPGILKKKELELLKEVNASMGLMLETTSKRLMKTIVHNKSPGKDPKLRIKSIENAGKLKIPFTTGLLIGIGETIEERAESLLEIKRLNDKYGHIQEIIIQNFKPKPGIPMESWKEPSLIEMIKMVAVTKLLFPDIGVQVPPNLNKRNAQIFLLAGADDWGGVSPLTKDYVNPEAPWPELNDLKQMTEEMGFFLDERLPVYNKFISADYLSDKILNKIKSF
ncbi:7,8-didemethyl-8-hydroxy-5-deazariboflavin synthase subunit CofG [Methanobacterium oryzae]|uniref:7,8-didemethyl-8-hydroxy-5-deazariboflavin synthase subunit CofG n=1 Tax=Methanobacterium oryzae TaxID=69540 RepID=UPI003D24E7F2